MTEQSIITYYANPHETVVEHLLPCRDMPEAVRATLPSWLKQMVGLRPEEIEKILEARWADVQDPRLRRLTKIAREFRPRSIMVFRGDAWLVLVRPQPNGALQANQSIYGQCYILLPPPTGAEVVWQGITRTRCADTPLLREFAKQFGGCHDMTPDANGAYYLQDKWQTLFDYWGDDENITNENITNWYPEWQSALVVYISTGGDMVLMHPNGSVVWCLVEGELSVIAENFAGFIDYIIEHNTIMPPDRYYE